MTKDLLGRNWWASRIFSLDLSVSICQLGSNLEVFLADSQLA